MRNSFNPIHTKGTHIFEPRLLQATVSWKKNRVLSVSRILLLNGLLTKKKMVYYQKKYLKKFDGKSWRGT